MEARFSIHHRLISSSYPAYFKFSVTIGSLALGTSMPLSGGLGLHQIETCASRHPVKKESHEFLRAFLFMASYIFLEKLTIDNFENKSSNSLF